MKKLKRTLLIALGEELFDEDVENTVFFQRSMNNSVELTTLAIKEYKYKNMTPKLFKIEPWLHQLTNIHHFQLFRMTRKTFENLLRVIGMQDTKKLLSLSYHGGHHAINLELAVYIFLWYMATQDTLLSIATRFKVVPATVMNTVNKVIYFVLLLKEKYIRFPRNLQELEDVSSRFKRYPGVVGAIDGSHIFVKVEREQQDSYIDRYRRHSINLMAICDSNTLFTYVFIGYPGSAHDSRVFENSIFFKKVERFGPNYYFKDSEKYHLIGDSAFALRPWLITPYRGDNLTRVQRHHNYCLSSERVVIEHAFGAYKGRWRRVQFVNTYNICKAVEIASAACVLHNFCLLNYDQWEDECCEYENMDTLEDMPERRRENIDRAAKLKRDAIAVQLFANKS